MPEIKLYQFGPLPGLDSGSPFCIKAHRALAFKGLAYEVANVGSPGEMKRINPDCRKVPVLEYDGELVPDSGRIFELLEQRHPDPPLFPTDEAALAQARLLADWAGESLYWYAVYLRWTIDENFQEINKAFFSRMPIPMRWFVPGVVRKGVIKTLQGQGIGRLPLDQVLLQLDRHFAMLEALLGQGPFFFGEALTAADLALFGPLAALRAPITPQARQLLDQHPALVAWLKQVDGRTTGEHTVAVT